MWGLLLLTTQRLCSGVSLAFVNTRAAEMLYNKQRVKRHHAVKSGLMEKKDRERAGGRAHLYRCECHWHCWDLLSHWCEEHLGEKHTQLTEYNMLMQTPSHKHQHGERWTNGFEKRVRHRCSTVPKTSASVQTISAQDAREEVRNAERQTWEKKTRQIPTVWTWTQESNVCNTQQDKYSLHSPTSVLVLFDLTIKMCTQEYPTM